VNWGFDTFCAQWVASLNENDKNLSGQALFMPRKFFAFKLLFSQTDWCSVLMSSAGLQFKNPNSAASFQIATTEYIDQWNAIVTKQEEPARSELPLLLFSEGNRFVLLREIDGGVLKVLVGHSGCIVANDGPENSINQECELNGMPCIFLSKWTSPRSLLTSRPPHQDHS